jgi:MSHA biogenesis protein MshM
LVEIRLQFSQSEPGPTSVDSARDIVLVRSKIRNNSAITPKKGLNLYRLNSAKNTTTIRPVTTNTVKILCEAFRIEFESSAFQCERKLIAEAFSLNRSGKMLVTIIDDAHLMEMENLRKLRLLLEDFPKNHNLILIGQVELLSNLDLAVNQDIKSRVTYSVVTKRLHDDVVREFIHRELDRIGLAHSTFTTGATELIIRSADGVLRRCRNLCLSAMLEAVRAANGRTIDIDVINRVLMQPHWQHQVDLKDF